MRRESNNRQKYTYNQEYHYRTPFSASDIAL